MRAVQLAATGGPELLRVVDVADPVPRAGQVLLRVHVSGVTFADTLIRAGFFPALLELPAILGREVVGTVAARGAGVHEPPMGARVAVMVRSGGYAELVAADARSTVRVPDGVRDEQALSVLGSGLTANGVVDAARVSADDHVLVTAAAGSIGSLAVQLAVRRGARVIGLASTPAKREIVHSLGAEAFDSTGEWEAPLRAATEGRGVDVVLDSVGGPTLTAGLRLLARRGRHVLYGFASGELGRVDPEQLGAMLARNISLIGYTLDPGDQAIQRRIADLLALIAAGALQVHTTSGYPLAEAGEAHRALTERRTSGKVLLTV